MKAEIDCISCILDDIAGAIKLMEITDIQRQEIMKECTEMMARGFRFEEVPSKYITAVHRIAKRISGIDVPFLPLREACNKVGIKLAAIVADELEAIDDPLERLRFLIRWAIAGNHIDFRTVGTGYDLKFAQIESTIRRSFDAGLRVDQTKKIFDLIKKSKTILFVHDNVGEIALDKLLIQELKKYSPKVISALRGGAITSDATVEDGKVVGIHDIASEVIIACGDTLGVAWDERTKEFKQALKEADLIIVKGQANYYVFSEHKDELKSPVVDLFSTKCAVVSSKFGETENINIATIL